MILISSFVLLSVSNLDVINEVKVGLDFGTIFLNCLSSIITCHCPELSGFLFALLRIGAVDDQSINPCIYIYNFISYAEY